MSSWRPWESDSSSISRLDLVSSPINMVHCTNHRDNIVGISVVVLCRPDKFPSLSWIDHHLPLNHSIFHQLWMSIDARQQNSSPYCPPYCSCHLPLIDCTKTSLSTGLDPSRLGHELRHQAEVLVFAHRIHAGLVQLIASTLPSRVDLPLRLFPTRSTDPVLLLLDRREVMRRVHVAGRPGADRLCLDLEIVRLGLALCHFLRLPLGV